ncbi:hepatic lectin-like [Mytilus edulis]|uniref:hepatic lectin-like n=1 Tax=Mytilus edulis TaxID=6550 RepID=UPI0039EF58DC
MKECGGRDFVYYDGLCVMASTVKLNWYEARTYCENLDGHLLVLDSQQKLNSAKELLQTYYQYFDLYVGASDGSTEDVWKWVSVTTASDFFYWRKGQPNNEDTQYPNKTANCGAVYPYNDLELHDEYCYQEKRFICEM